ncbi:toxin Bro [Clostridioides difficile]|nr:toxin Bro [Clostridioides difficile]
MKELSKVTTNEELGVKVKTIKYEDGSIGINAEDTAVGFGWYQTQNKNDKKYVSIRWETINKYCKEFGFPNKLGKDDYIPESLFYMLGMKAKNEMAVKFQKWLAIDVLPSIRKTGTYSKKTKDIKDESEIKYMNAQARLKNARAREAKIYLELADKVDIKEYKQIMYSKTTELISGEALIPLPKSEKKTYSATEIGKMLGISANKVGGLANAYNLKTDEYGIKVWDKAKYSDKQVENFRYYENVIPVLEKALNAFEN